jgi:hypothetical protein
MDARGRRDSPGYKIGYARVSTLDQNLALQQDALKEAGREKIFIEQMSGAVTDRPALREALEYARSGDTLVVWKLDRLARSMKQLIETIEKLRLRNIGFRSLTEAIDTTTAQGVLIFHMFSALAEFERALIRERTRAGLVAAKRAGRTGGRPPKLSEDDLDVARTCSSIPISPLRTLPSGWGYRPRRCTDICPPRRRQTALRPDSVWLPRFLERSKAVDFVGLFRFIIQVQRAGAISILKASMSAALVVGAASRRERRSMRLEPNVRLTGSESLVCGR